MMTTLTTIAVIPSTKTAVRAHPKGSKKVITENNDGHGDDDDGEKGR